MNEGGIPQNFEQQKLADIYIKAQIKKKLMHHLVIILKNKNLISVSINQSSRTIDLWLNKNQIPPEFLDQRIFEKETQNVKDLRNAMTTGVRSITIAKLVEKIFKNNNILTWEV
ncbi:hypothetical protein D3C86_1801650 [compost metagenome]